MGTETQGNDPPEGSQGTSAPATLSGDDINRAITARLKAFEKTFTATVAAQVADVIASKFSEMEEARKADPAKPAAVQESPEFKSLQKQLSELKNKHAAAEQAALEKTAKERDTRLRATVVEELAKVGIPAPNARMVLPYLLDAKRVLLDLDDAAEPVVWMGEDKIPRSIADGLKAWSSTDEAKIYLPARGAAGSGDRPLGPSGPGPKSATDHANAILAQAFGGG